MEDIKDVGKQLKECMKEFRDSHKLVMEKHKEFIKTMDSKLPLSNTVFKTIDPPLFVVKPEPLIIPPKPKIKKSKKPKETIVF
jgi:hypothetical protein